MDDQSNIRVRAEKERVDSTKEEADLSSKGHKGVIKKGKLVTNRPHVTKDMLQVGLVRSNHAPKLNKKWEDYIR